jgi:hypothetical protein
MKRLEIVANQSILEELCAALEAAVPGIGYTVSPVAHGRGSSDWRWGTVIWPEQNIILFSYLDEEQAGVAETTAREVKAMFPNEGMKVWLM